MPYIPTDTTPFAIEKAYNVRHVPPQTTVGIGWSGRWRFYFNSRHEAPLIWSVDRGTIASEVKLREIHLVNCSATTHFNPRADNVRAPKATCEGWGRVEIFDGVATIYPQERIA